jgi:uridylate kinase
MTQGTSTPSPTEDADSAGYRRVLLKLSGEAFAGNGGLGVDPDVVSAIARQVADVVSSGVEVAATTSAALS